MVSSPLPVVVRIFHLNGDWLIWLIDYLLFYVPLKIFFTYMETSQLPVKGQIQAYAREGGIFIVPHRLWHGPLFFRSHPKDRPIQSPLTTHKGMWRTYSNKDPHGLLTWRLIDWLIDYLRFYVPLKNFSLLWRRHYCRWRAAKFRPMLGAQGLWAGRDLYRATPTVTRDLGFSGLIRRTAPFSRLLRHTRGCGGSILTRILTGGLHEEVTISCEGLQHLNLLSVLLWYGTSVYPVSSEGPPHL
jgi:hypothetical protein